jgi:hypothetical protein
MVAPVGRWERYVETSPPSSRRMRKRREPGAEDGRLEVDVRGGRGV